MSESLEHWKAFYTRHGVAPPYVQTELGGSQQATDPRAMPLQEFTDEVLQILENNSIVKGKTLVEKVKHLRWAEQTGEYEKTLEAFAAYHD